MKILFISAVKNEISYLIKNKEQSIKILGNELFIKKNNFGIASGVGFFNTSLYLTHSIETIIKPHLIVQVGIAGAFKNSNLEIGDLAIAEKEINLQFGIEKNGFPILNPPFYAIDKLKIKRTYETNKEFSNLFYEKLRKNFKIQKGNFISTSTITNSIETANLIEKNFNCIVENMEGAASIHIANIYNIPFVEIRSISNFVGKRNLKNWDKELAFKNINEAIKCLIS